MSVSGLCEVCESTEAVDRCERCGALVCDRHFDAETGFCATCAAETKRGQGGGRQFSPDDVPGEYEF